MKSLACVGLLLALAGCGGNDGPMTDQQACERQANNHPAVQALILKGIGNPHFQGEGQDQLRYAKQDATIACLRSRGVIKPGGVERQRN